MRDFVIECGEFLQNLFPNMSWEEAMDIITTDCPMSKQVQNIILRRRANER